MALTLDLSYLQSNDNTVIQFTDATGETGAGEWGVGGNIDYTDIDGTLDDSGAAPVRAGLYTLELYIDITDSDGTTTSYDGIDLFTEFGGVGFAALTDLVFEIKATHLQVAGVAYGTATTELPDGIWDITYQAYDVVGVTIYDTDSILEDDIQVDGIVRVGTYDDLREIPEDAYMYEDEAELSRTNWENMLIPLQEYMYLVGMEAAASLPDTDKLLDMQNTLETLIANNDA